MPKKKVNDVKAEIKKIVKKKKRKVYFGQEVQNAVVEYNSSTNDNERNLIYGTRIHAAFDKLAENIINTFKFTYFDMPFEDVKHEVVAFMVMNIHKYDHTKGSKAFSYFSVVAKNYLILHNNNNYKKLKSHDGMDVLDREKNLKDMDYDYGSFTTEIVEYFDKNLNTIFKKDRDLKIGYAIVDLIKAREEIENFNKKALYILIREMTDVETAHITSVVNVLKKHYKKLVNKYHKNGTIMIDSSGSFF
ncbi:MAG: hypothetical protein CBC24_05100 [Candidatus Pelagibacter sp. TMED64]|nr:MAG: hypothetical protein CBC24_05100 [Candidatus Pelagibacter sp. TMED64]